MSEKSNFLFRSLDGLKKNSIAISGPIEVELPRFYRHEKKRIGIFDPRQDLESVEHVYLSVNGVVGFIDGEKLYVIPEAPNVLRILKLHGFVEDRYMKVPFSWGECPTNEPDKIKWEHLSELKVRMMQKQRYQEDKLRKKAYGAYM